MEDHEEVYDQETAAGQEVTESAESEPSETEAVETGAEESDQGGPGSEEDGADPEEENGEEQTETESVEDVSGESQEEEMGEEQAEGREEETVSGNDIVIRGDVVVFPEGYEPVMSEGESALEDTGEIVKAIETQNDIIRAGSACTVFMLGVLAGAMIIAGFRLRRV